MQKILFNSKYGLEQAVFDGRKTMTRRAISPRVWEKYRNYERWYHSGNIFGELKDENEDLTSNLAPYKVGEVVAIAQSYRTVMCNNPLTREELNENGVDNNKYLRGFHNKMFVKPALMPHHIKITELKVERLQHITDEDCLREGIDKAYLGYYANGLRTRDWEKESHVEKDGKTYKLFPTPRKAFAALIDKVSGKGTWASNPWVFAYSFELID